MATASQAIEQVAKATGILPATVFRAARSLREADTGMWPQGTQGRGKAAHVESRHLVNLILALGVADPITTSPQLVPEWRFMPARDSIGWMVGANRPQDTMLRGCCFGEVSVALDKYRDIITPGLPKVLNENGSWSGQGDPRCYQVLPGKMLGSALDTFIEYIAWCNGNNIVANLRKVHWHLRLFSTRFAEVIYHEDGINFSSRFEYPESIFDPPGYNKTPGYIKSAAFSFSVIETLADLYRDTFSRIGIPVGERKLRKKAKLRAYANTLEADRQHETANPMLPDAPDSAPDFEATATDPLPGTGAAAPSDQPVGTDMVGRQHLQPTSEIEKSQPVFEPQAGHSPQQWSDDDGE